MTYIIISLKCEIIKSGKNELIYKTEAESQMLKRNLELSREKHCCSVAQSCPTLCKPMNCITREAFRKLLGMKIADIFWISNDKWDVPVSLLCNSIAYGASAGGCYFKVCRSHHKKVPLVGFWSRATKLLKKKQVS